MDANSIWSGFEYARTQWPSRGVEYYAHADRIKVIIVYKRREPGNQRDTAYAKVTFLDTETGEPRQKSVYDTKTGMYVNEDDIREVRAREIFMRWDEYEDETEHRKQQMEQEEKERAERYEKQRQERRDREEAERIRYEQENAERLRLAQERANKLERDRTAIKTALAVKGVPIMEGITVTDSSVTLSLITMKKLLGLPIAIEGVV